MTIKPLRLLVSSWVLSLTLTLVPSALAKPPPHAGIDGPFGVGFSRLHAVNPDGSPWGGNDRPLSISFWYPTDEDMGTQAFYEAYPYSATLPSPLGALLDVPVSQHGPFPLIVFSHGDGGLTELHHNRLFERLASHGFIIAAPLHTGNTESDARADTFGLDCPLQDAGQIKLDASGCVDPDEFRIGLNRIDDVQFAISLVERLSESQSSFLADGFDRARIGLAGFSRGTVTVGSIVSGIPEIGLLRDERVSAALLLDPVTFLRVGPGQFADIPYDRAQVPVLPIAGSETDFGWLGLAAGLHIFELLETSPRQFVSIPISGHLAFTQYCELQEAHANASGLANPYGFNDFFANPDAFASKVAYNLATFTSFYGSKEQCRDILHPNFHFTPTTPPLVDPDEVLRISEKYAVAFFELTLMENHHYKPILTRGHANKNEPLVVFDVDGGKKKGSKK